MRILSGIQPSGQLHLGNYFGAIAQFVQRQEAGDELFIFIADWHALTSVHDPEELRQSVREVAAAYIACGLDPAKVALYRQSDVKEIAELAWILNCVAPMGLLERAHSYKDKVAKGLSANVGLFTYPVLMAADILIVKPDIVPVGKDQKQHVEITRDLAGKFNDQYGDVFKLPEPKIPEHVAVIPGTDGAKMSKSYGNTVDLFGSDAELKKQVMSIQTDSKEMGESLEPDGCNVFELFKLMADESEINELAEKYRAGTIGYGDAKKLLLEKIHATFDPARARFAELMANSAEIEQIFTAGAEKAKAIAKETLAETRQKVGLE